MRCAVFGASGGIGGALVDALLAREDVTALYAGSRKGPTSNDARVRSFAFDLKDENSIAAGAAIIGEGGSLDLAIVATGVLQRDPDIRPERSWRALDADVMTEIFAINTIGPALIGKHVMPLLRRDSRAVFAVLSARVGSIGDNGIGGWHSYRASKAALNMLVKNFAIEGSRRNKELVCVALHPGTVDTRLSEPFQSNVPGKQLFDAPRAAGQLLDVMHGLTPADNGGFFAWDGQPIGW